MGGSCWASQMALVIKNLPTNAGDLRDMGSIPGSGRSPGGGHGNPLQYSCLENPLDRGAWRATVRRVTKSGTRLERLGMHVYSTILSHPRDLSGLCGPIFSSYNSLSKGSFPKLKSRLDSPLFKALLFKILKNRIKVREGGFPGGLVVRTWYFHYQGLGLIPGWETQVGHDWSESSSNLAFLKLSQKRKRKPPSVFT